LSWRYIIDEVTSIIALLLCHDEPNFRLNKFLKVFKEKTEDELSDYMDGKMAAFA
jgi:hypothetical protein